ncbi:MAG: ribose-5-phosphate isomerase [Patescibacteria group bacterium]|nr:ribose-5-phosphate isomerase [Patescibacteria group bacterium]
MKIYLGADHGGYELKKVLKEHLAQAGHDIEDLGAHTYDPLDNYPQYAFAVASKVLGEDDSLGILMCKSGQGMAIAANRIGGIRAAIAWNEEVAAHARRDDDVNVLVLAPLYTKQEDCIKAADAWLATEFSKSPKYQHRLDQIEQLYG